MCLQALCRYIPASKWAQSRRRRKQVERESHYIKSHSLIPVSPALVGELGPRSLVKQTAQRMSHTTVVRLTHTSQKTSFSLTKLLKFSKDVTLLYSVFFRTLRKCEIKTRKLFNLLTYSSLYSSSFSLFRYIISY